MSTMSYVSNVNNVKNFKNVNNINNVNCKSVKSATLAHHLGPIFGLVLHFLERIVLSVLIYVWHFSSTALLREIIWVLNQGKIGPFFYLQGIPDAWLGKINFILYVASGLFTEKIFQSHFILINYTTWLNFRPCRPLFRKVWNYL